MSIEVKNLTKKYGDQEAISSVSFQIDKGEIAGFIGPNGAGKSTTMKILACYTLPTSGEAYVNGISIYDQPLKIRQTIGYLPEQNPLYNDLYVIEYLEFLYRLHHLKGNRKKRIAEMIEMTGLGDEKHKKIGQLSKGYRQRVGLAQSLIHNPDVLILDEPTSGLDPNQIVDIRNLIREIGKTRTVLLSSHILQEVQAICSRIIIIDKGKIVADDITEKLLKMPVSLATVRVRFKNTVEKESLSSLPVKDILYKDNYWFITSEDAEIREKIYEFAVSSGNIILELSQETGNLEQIFQQLTQKP
ncbi:MAG TPA: ATP-binding cassette domain-containing protein [Bacteroidia bacterium]|nr:ATP-binding cassette domain-containing protein [Bacteroidia bacterium]HRS59063.1 ATP-binding cassette domain-containing protein [Bacteroidia bacterium]HRU68965.1 ATP-binding cassette domain-containing protein [Bacteroidia bacterium]